mgnify:FL=1
MVDVQNLYHSYGNGHEHAVEDVSFSIGKGENFGFLGPSGTGKSTTQAVLSGLLPLQRGEIIIDEKQRDGRPDKAFFNRIGVGFEIPNVYRKISGLDNLIFHASLYDGETLEPMEALEMVGLAAEARKKAGAYSKGMMQRLGFARSMINKPDIWFLDEPTMGLDPTTANSIKGIIRKQQAEGTTIFLTTHNMYVADELCDRVAFIVDGKIVAVDAPKNLKLSYGESIVNVEYRENGGLKAAAFGLAGEDKRQLQEFMGNHDIATIHSGEPTLEDVFVRITGRGLE